MLAVVVEVQLRRDLGKRLSWPVYLTTLRARLDCPTALLVLCHDPAVAGWCASPIDLGHPGWTLRPLVAGPEQVPVIADPADATRSPELAVLSAISHGGAHPERDKVLYSLLAGLDAIDADHAARYADLVLAALPRAARHLLEELMTTGTHEYQSDFARRYFSQGRAEGEAEGEAKGEARGEAKAVLAVLAARGVDVPDDARERIVTCADLDQLDAWVRRAVTVDTVEQLFA